MYAEQYDNCPMVAKNWFKKYLYIDTTCSNLITTIIYTFKKIFSGHLLKDAFRDDTVVKVKQYLMLTLVMAVDTLYIIIWSTFQSRIVLKEDRTCCS